MERGLKTNLDRTVSSNKEEKTNFHDRIRPGIIVISMFSLKNMMSSEIRRVPMDKISLQTLTKIRKKKTNSDIEISSISKISKTKIRNERKKKFKN